MKWAALVLGGTAGTLARYLVTTWFYQSMGPLLPWGTLAVNTLGCFGIGLVAAIPPSKGIMSPEVRLFCATGFCGAFTTFSAFILETNHLVSSRGPGMAFMNMAAGLMLGYLAFRAGFLLAGRAF